MTHHVHIIHSPDDAAKYGKGWYYQIEKVWNGIYNEDWDTSKLFSTHEGAKKEALSRGCLLYTSDAADE